MLGNQEVMIASDGAPPRVLLEGVIVMKSNVMGFSLPRNRPQNVMMAVHHIITLAHTAVIHARSVEVNSPDGRTRRAGDVQGTLDEIAFLEEELRIKDARMAKIDPHRGRTID